MGTLPLRSPACHDQHEEVRVDRVPVQEEVAAEAEIGEEEVVVEKRPVAKEEVRIRKDVVEDTEVVEEDVRHEEVDIDEETTSAPANDKTSRTRGPGVTPFPLFIAPIRRTACKACSRMFIRTVVSSMIGNRQRIV